MDKLLKFRGIWKFVSPSEVYVQHMDIFKCQHLKYLNLMDFSDNFGLKKNAYKHLNLLTLDEYISRIFNPCTDDINNEISVFLMNYRKFSNPIRIFEALISLYSLGCNDMSKKGKFEFHMFYMKTLYPLRLRMGIFLTIWVRDYYSDFEKNIKLKLFLEELLMIFTVTKLSTVANKIMVLIKSNDLKCSPKKKSNSVRFIGVRKRLIPDKKRSSNNVYIQRVVRSSTFMRSRSLFQLANLDFTKIPPANIAKYFTQMEFEIFERIKPLELFDYLSKKQECVNVSSLIKLGTAITKWMVQLILSEVDNRQFGVFVFLLKCTEEAQKNNNFNLLVNMVGALKSHSIYQMVNKNLAMRQNKKLKKKLNDMSKITSYRRNFKLLRITQSRCPPPMLPSLHTVLTDLTFTIDGNRHMDGKINVNCCKIIHDIISKFLNRQTSRYEIKTCTTYNMVKKKFLEMAILKEEGGK